MFEGTASTSFSIHKGEVPEFFYNNQIHFYINYQLQYLM